MTTRPAALPVALGLALGLASPVHATTDASLSERASLVLERGTTEYPLTGVTQYLEDRGAALTLDELLSGEHAWAPSERDPNFGFTSSAFWLRLRLVNPADQPEQLVLSFEYPLLDNIAAYVEQPDGSFERHQLGDRYPFSARTMRTVSLALPIAVAAQSSSWIYFRVHTASSMQIDIELTSHLGFVQRTTERQFFIGLYYGIMLVMVLYNLFLYLAIRNRSYLLYVVFVSAFVLMQMALDGSASRYLFPEMPGMANNLAPLSIAFAQTGLMLFTQHFLGTKTLVPRVHLATNIGVSLALIGLVLALFAPYALSIRFLAALAIVTSGGCEVAGIIVWRKGYRPARFYVLAWTALITGTVIFVLTSFGVLPANWFTVNVQRIGSALEVTLLSFALGDRINAIEREREHARARALVLDRDMALTGTVQQLFLPKRDALSDAGFGLVGFSRPAARCGGDWWWYERLPDGTLMVLLGDVTGHGTAAAMMTAAVASAYHACPPVAQGSQIPDLLRSIDRSFTRMAGGLHQMSMAAIAIDPERRTLRMWNAGAPPAFIQRANGEVVDLAAPGRLMGEDELELGTASIELSAGDRVFAFSDGLPELIKANGRPLGYRGVQRLLLATRERDLSSARDQLELELDALRGEQPQHDDLTFVLVELGDNVAARPSARRARPSVPPVG